MKNIKNRERTNVAKYNLLIFKELQSHLQVNVI